MVFVKRLRLHKNQSGELYLDLKGGSPYGTIQIPPNDLDYYLSIGWEPSNEAQFNAQDDAMVEKMEREALEDKHASGPTTIARLEYIDRLLKELAN